MFDLQTKCCPRSSASGNILSSGPTYNMLPSSPVNNCIIVHGDTTKEKMTPNTYEHNSFEILNRNNVDVGK